MKRSERSNFDTFSAFLIWRLPPPAGCIVGNGSRWLFMQLLSHQNRRQTGWSCFVFVILSAASLSTDVRTCCCCPSSCYISMTIIFAMSQWPHVHGGCAAHPVFHQWLVSSFASFLFLLHRNITVVGFSEGRILQPDVAWSFSPFCAFPPTLWMERELGWHARILYASSCIPYWHPSPKFREDMRRT